jgi:Fe-S cluster assembly iron-binding protein IscA
MALDEPVDTDTEFEVDDFKFIVNSDFLEKAKPIKVDFHMYGFKLDCAIDFGAACTSCGTKGSCCA